MPCAIDAVVLDLGLPDRPGEVLFREIRALHPSLPVVFATGQGAGARHDLFKGETNVAYLTKPYDANDLIRAIRAVGIAGISKP
jgi:DNA-binding response OmpR family regulator